MPGMLRWWMPLKAALQLRKVQGDHQAHQLSRLFLSYRRAALLHSLCANSRQTLGGNPAMALAYASVLQGKITFTDTAPCEEDLADGA
jgi:hypothetical protein